MSPVYQLGYSGCNFQQPDAADYQNTDSQPRRNVGGTGGSLELGGAHSDTDSQPCRQQSIKIVN